MARLAAIVVLVAAGAAVKTIGAMLSGSRALLVDALTCFSSLAALAGVLHYLRVGSMPPDRDHPYGHSRLRYGGVLVSLSAYMFAAGASAAAVVSGLEGYRVEPGPGIVAAVAGAALYAVALLLARGMDPVLARYAGFTFSEIIESAVSVVGAALGGLLGYWYDLAGAAVIVGYIFHEAVEAHRELLRILCDTSAPEEMYRLLEEEALLRGLRVMRARLRMLDERSCGGDAVLAPPDGMDPVAADMLADEVAAALAERGCDVVIHLAYAESSPGRRASERSSRSTEPARLK